MKKCVTIFISILCIMFSHAQSKDFEQVYKACLLVQSSMSEGEGSYMEIDRAVELLNISNWSSFRLHNLDGKDQVKCEKESIVFSPEFLMNYSQKKKFIRKGKKYASKNIVKHRINKHPVKLSNIIIAGKSKVTYGTRIQGNSLTIAAVSEVNGLINLSVTLLDNKGKKFGPYKSATKEFEGCLAGNYL